MRFPSLRPVHAVLLSLLLLVPQFAVAKARSGDVAKLRQCVENYSKGAPQSRANGGCVGIVGSACGGETTLAISECLQRETAAWDALLNEWWTPLRAKAKADGSWNRLLAAQRQWIKDRDAECRRVYDEAGGGSIRVIWAAECMRDLTAKRAVEFFYMLYR